MTELLEGIDLSELRGRKQKQLLAAPVRALREADLVVLTSEERGTPARPIQRLRDRHHAVARLVANGLTNGQISLMTGMDPGRVSVLRSDPTFKELVSDYQKIDAGLQAEFLERATTLSLTAMNNLQEMLEDDENSLPALTQLEVAKFASDRTGHGPVTKTSNVNVNVELGSRLESARKRLANVIEGEATIVDSGGGDDAQTLLDL